MPSDSYLGQVTIVPVMPFCVGFPVTTGEIGHASNPLDGSIWPASWSTAGAGLELVVLEDAVAGGLELCLVEPPQAASASAAAAIDRRRSTT